MLNSYIPCWTFSFEKTSKAYIIISSRKFLSWCGIKQPFKANTFRNTFSHCACTVIFLSFVLLPILCQDCFKLCLQQVNSKYWIFRKYVDFSNRSECYYVRIVHTVALTAPSPNDLLALSIHSCMSVRRAYPKHLTLCWCSESHSCDS